MSPSLAELLDLVIAIGASDNGWSLEQVNAYRDANFPGVDITRLRPQMTKNAAALAEAVKQEFAAANAASDATAVPASPGALAGEIARSVEQKAGEFSVESNFHV